MNDADKVKLLEGAVKKAVVILTHGALSVDDAELEYTEHNGDPAVVVSGPSSDPFDKRTIRMMLK